MFLLGLFILLTVLAGAATLLFYRPRDLGWLWFVLALPVVLIMLLVGAFVANDVRLVGLPRLHYALIRPGMTTERVEALMGPPHTDVNGSKQEATKWSPSGRCFRSGLDQVLTDERLSDPQRAALIEKQANSVWMWAERGNPVGKEWFVTVVFDSSGRVIAKNGSFCSFD